MSEYYKGITFAEQNASPVDDAVIRRMLLSDGVLAGCDLSYAGYTLTMASGYLIACGRQIRHPTAENWAIADASSGYARVLMTIDMTRTSTEEVFDQVNTSIEYATSKDGFPALIQDDINATGSKYQVALAVVSLGTGGITGIVSELELAESSGGGGLNFSVVGGTTQPENPKENTIWVNTETEISGWVFSAEEPGEPAEGMVWIYTGIYGGVEFNALKKNVIQICPIYAKQYADGAWVDKTAKSYHGGAWKEWITYLYNEGDECTDLTGGWSATATKPSGAGSNAVAPSVTKGSESITISVTSGYPNYRIGYLTSAYQIDLRNYNKLIVNVTALSIHCYVHVSKSKTSGYTPSALMELSVGSNVLDISSLSGSFYILIGMGGQDGTASCTFDKVYLS